MSDALSQLEALRLPATAPGTAVAPAAPTALSTNMPAPTMGLSPTRPGIFQLRPLVVVQLARSPLASTAEQLMVPQVKGMVSFSASSVAGSPGAGTSGMRWSSSTRAYAGRGRSYAIAPGRLPPGC